jgi:hypothetical protein
MRILVKALALFFFSQCLAYALPHAQAPSTQEPSATPDSKPSNKIQKSDPQTRITIEVTGGEKDAPVENASVYLKYVEEHAIKKNKKLELNVKTSHEGVAHIPDAPMGRALIQIIAEGWKTYGRWYDITDPKQVIKIHLERPPKWY